MTILAPWRDKPEASAFRRPVRQSSGKLRRSEGGWRLRSADFRQHRQQKGGSTVSSCLRTTGATLEDDGYGALRCCAIWSAASMISPAVKYISLAEAPR